GFVALALALSKLRVGGVLNAAPLRGLVSATSVGMIGGLACLDLNYIEDSQADVDMNVVRTDADRFVEVQGTAERSPFTREQMHALVDLAMLGTNRLFEHQKQALGALLPALLPRP